ncbi:hypothetical protein E2562_030395 [Oryza meyeriana var. granulata]|uniref:Glycosyltransferase n=1 Tax=Oryza meyeriana var. granulata TaxID=110450 RepID=A0A6G1FDS9_9ORYZ|nr:hypothetical protein E2562_030395 [Oryza meyeriana var. granulata]
MAVASDSVNATPPPSPSPHFVMVPFAAQGHTIPMVDLALLLAGRGARTSLVTTPLNAARLHGVADLVRMPVEIVEIPFPAPAVDGGLPPGCESVDQIKDLSQIFPFLGALRELAGPLDAYLRELAARPSCVISDSFNPWPAGVARRVGVPQLFFQSSSCFYSLCDLSAATHGMQQQQADGERYAVLGMPIRVEVTRATQPDFFDEAWWETVRKETMDATRNADGVVVNTFMDIADEFVACYEAALGKPVWTLGPFCLCNRDADAMASRGNRHDVAQSAVTAWLDAMDTDSVVYVNFGSLVRKVPRRGLVVRCWAPQLAILSHRAVGGFVTHGGWNSMLAAVTHGVPVVTWPHFADQFLNERTVVKMVSNEAVPVTRADVIQAVLALMDGGEVGEERRKKAKEYGEKARGAMEKGGSSSASVGAQRSEPAGDSGDHELEPGWQRCERELSPATERTGRQTAQPADEAASKFKPKLQHDEHKHELVPVAKLTGGGRRRPTGE